MDNDLKKREELNEIVQTLDMEAGRRAFLKAIGGGTVGAAVFASAAGLPLPAEAQAITDNDILNFALNLEYLEATFYSFANDGTDIPMQTQMGPMDSPPGQLSGGRKANLSNPLVKAYAKEIADEELRHVQVLRIVLGKDRVARPAINIGSAFSDAATAAGVPNGASFSPYKDDISFLIGSYIFEDVGVTAYHGAAGLLQNKTYLNYAAGILAVEAYHAGIIRTALFAQQNADIVDVTQKISDLRSKLANNGRAGVDDVGIGTVRQPTLVPVNAPNATMFQDLGPRGGDAIAYARTTDQVLNIVYGNQNKTPGLFFPNGMNGAIK